MSTPDDARSPTSCRDAELSLGALVLGALEPAQRLDVEAHVATCERCRDALAELAPLPGLLNRLSVDQAEAGLPEPDARLLEAALAVGMRPEVAPAEVEATRVRSVSRRRRWWTAAAVAAAAAVLATAGVLATRAQDGTPPTAGPSPTSTTGDSVLWDGASTDGAIQASVVLVPQGTGSRLSMTLSGVKPGQRCDLVIESTTGRREVTASWQATYEGAATVTGSTSAAPQQVSSMRVTTPQGDTLLQLWRAP
ncbi:MAG TPA: zf-HC2 domain-containing protein [Actinomycetales bacterium]|nr:zf-HC2 domain-containing protein [Actinomycetales bacterium]